MVWSGTNKEIKKDYLFPFKMVMQEKSRVLNNGYYLIYLFTLIYTQLVLEMYFYKSDFCLAYSRFIIILDNVTAHME